MRKVSRPRVGDQGHHLVGGGKPCRSDAGGHHRGIAEDGSAGGKCGVGRADHGGCEGNMFSQVDLAAGVDQPHHHPGDVLGEPGEVLLGPDGGEGLPVDIAGVADVVEHTITLRRGRKGVIPIAGGHQHLGDGGTAAGPLAAHVVHGARNGAGFRHPRCFGAHIRPRPLASRTAHAGGHIKPGRGVIEHQAQRRQHPQLRVSQALLEIAHQQ